MAAIDIPDDLVDIPDDLVDIPVDLVDDIPGDLVDEEVGDSGLSLEIPDTTQETLDIPQSEGQITRDVSKDVVFGDDPETKRLALEDNPEFQFLQDLIGRGVPHAKAEDILQKEKIGVEPTNLGFAVAAGIVTGGSSAGVLGGIRGGLAAAITDPFVFEATEEAIRINPALGVLTAIGTGHLSDRAANKILKLSGEGLKNIFGKIKKSTIKSVVDGVDKDVVNALNKLKDELPPEELNLAIEKAKGTRTPNNINGLNKDIKTGENIAETVNDLEPVKNIDKDDIQGGFHIKENQVSEFKYNNVTDSDIKNTTKSPLSPDYKINPYEDLEVNLKDFSPDIKDVDLGIDTVETTLSRMKKTFTRFIDLDEPIRQKFINVSEGMSEILDKAVIATGNLFKGKNQNLVDDLYKHLQEPSIHKLPEGMEGLKDNLIKIKNWSLKALNRSSLSKKDFKRLENVLENELPMPTDLQGKLFVKKFPDTKIKELNDRKLRLQLKLKNLSKGDSTDHIQLGKVNPVKTRIEAEISEIDGHLDRLSNVEFFHQITSKEGFIKNTLNKAKSFTKKPQAFLGRKFLTREDAIKAGRNVGSLPEAIADTIYETNKFLIMDDFIRNINRNRSMSAVSKKASSSWRSFDSQKFPSARNMKYHPAIKDAIDEITYSASKHELTSLYDKINTSMKMIGFYNPLFMGRFNTEQGVRAAGFKWFKKFPEAYRIYKDKGEIYQTLKKNGVFNSNFEMKTSYDDISSQLNKIIGTNKDKQFVETMKEVINPVNLTKKTWKALNESTWKLDEIQRISTYLALKEDKHLARHLSDFQLMEFVNDAHANYNKVPTQTRRILNRAVFTPTYRISMARVVGKIHREPKIFWKQLMRHYAMKIAINKFIPMGMTAYYLSTGLNKKADVDGYRLIIKEPGKRKERVFSLSSPLLEGTKVLNRPLNRTVEFNLAAVPAAIVNVLRGPIFKKKDATWKDTVNSFFKTGTPGLKELGIWQREDLDMYEKFISLVGGAYIYDRNRQKLPEEPFIKDMLKAMDLWIDYKKILGLEKDQTKKRTRGKRPTTRGEEE